MRIVDDAAALPSATTGTDAGAVVEPFCVLTEDPRSEVASGAADLLGLDLDHGPRTLRRPAAVTIDGTAHLVVFALLEDQQLTPVRISVAEGGFLVVATESVLAPLRTQLREASVDVWSAAIGVLLGLAHRSQDVVDAMTDASRQLEVQARGFTSAPQRREMARLRDQLFEIYEIEEAQRRLLAPEEDLAGALTEHQLRLLKRAAHGFDTTRSMATQLYARLGDVLDQQGTIVSERLTVIATLILPLTLVTGFFGMNFGWMTDRIDSLPSFVMLGLGVPVVLVILTLALTRYITRSS